MSKFGIGRNLPTKCFCLVLSFLFGLIFLQLFLTSFHCHQQEQQLETATGLDSSGKLTIAEALAEIKNKIMTNPIQKSKYQYQYFQLKSDENGNGNDNELSVVSKKRTIFILTTWRSGSTFLGEAMSQHPEIFYHFEPLIFYHDRGFESGPDLEQVLPLLKDLSECRYQNVDRSMIDVKRLSFSLLGKNPKIEDECERLGNSCFSPDFLNSACRLFPVHLMKSVRLHGSVARQLLHEFEDRNPHLIYLLRDPRAIWASRLKQPVWCGNETGVSNCRNITNLCQSLTADLTEVKHIQSKYRKQITVMRYEDVALNPSANFKMIFKKLGISWSEKIEEYIKIHTNTNGNSESGRPLPTFRVSKERVSMWQTQLRWSEVDEIQTGCRDFMTQLGYPLFNSRNFNVTDELNYIYASSVST